MAKSKKPAGSGYQLWLEEFGFILTNVYFGKLKNNRIILAKSKKHAGTGHRLELERGGLILANAYFGKVCSFAMLRIVKMARLAGRFAGLGATSFILADVLKTLFKPKAASLASRKKHK